VRNFRHRNPHRGLVSRRRDRGCDGKASGLCGECDSHRQLEDSVIRDIFAVVMGEKGCKIHVGCIFNCCRGCGRYMEKLLKMNTLYRWDVGTVVATLTVTVNFPIVGWLVCLVLLMS
jgi:hypothetical protein